MAINKAMRKVLKALSFDGIEVEASRHLANLKALDPVSYTHLILCNGFFTAIKILQYA